MLVLRITHHAVRRLACTSSCDCSAGACTAWRSVQPASRLLGPNVSAGALCILQAQVTRRSAEAFGSAARLLGAVHACWRQRGRRL
jgi:hypothetical protein